jgi:release factor glutamine methyltransferase
VKICENLRTNIYRTDLSPRILDLCTGCGAIAIALAKNIENAEVWATDISEEALEIAKKNAEQNHVNITFLQHDILDKDVSINVFNHKGHDVHTKGHKDNLLLNKTLLDIIVANPPYIPESERNQLHKNVVNYEPHNALFVPDENPLIFYEAIADTAKKILREGGVLYFETHEKFHLELSAMLAEKGFKEIELWNDMNGKPRFASGKKL